MKIVIRHGKMKQYLVRLMMISLFFDAYCFIYVENFPVTLFTVVSMVFIVYMGLNAQIKIEKTNKTQFLWGLVFVFFIIFNMFMVNNEITQENNVMSAFKAVYYVFLYMLSQRVLDSHEIDKEMHVFQILVNVAAVYGVLQIGLQFLGLSGDLWIPGHMVLGYNWGETGTGFIGSSGIRRAHAFFSEPSTYSQILGINILIYLSNGPKKNLKYIILNTLSLIASVSGTGILLVLIGVLYFLTASHDKRMHKIGWNSVFLGLIAIVLLYVLANDLFENFLYRIYKIFDSGNTTALMNTGVMTSSGYVRFIGVWKVLGESLKKSPLFGCGIGAGQEFIKYLNWGNRYTLDNGLVHVAVELGIVGTIAYIGLIVGNIKLRNYKNSTLIVIVLIALNFLNDVFSQNYYWGLMCFFNIVGSYRSAEFSLRSKQSEILNDAKHGG